MAEVTDDPHPTPHDFGAPEVDEYAEYARRKEEEMANEKLTDDAEEQLQRDQEVGDERRAAEAARQAGQKNTGTLDKKGWA